MLQRPYEGSTAMKFNGWQMHWNVASCGCRLEQRGGIGALDLRYVQRIGRAIGPLGHIRWRIGQLGRGAIGPPGHWERRGPAGMADFPAAVCFHVEGPLLPKGMLGAPRPPIARRPRPLNCAIVPCQEHNIGVRPAGGRPAQCALAKCAGRGLVCGGLAAGD